MGLSIASIEQEIAERSVPRDQWGRPLVVPKGGGKPVAHQRTTTFIDVLADKSNLIDWGKRMVVVGAGKLTVDDFEAIGQAYQNDDKTTLSKYAEKALAIAGGNDKRNKGTELHYYSELLDQGLPLPEYLSEVDREDIGAYMEATMDLEFVGVEQFVVVNELLVAGTFDRSIQFTGKAPDTWIEDETIVSDLKTGSVKYDPLKIAMQLAIYARGEVYDFDRFPVDTSDKKAFAAWKKTEFSAAEAQKAYTPNPMNQEWGLVINLPSGSAEVTMYWADLILGWEAAKLAAKVRDWRKLGKDALVKLP